MKRLTVLVILIQLGVSASAQQLIVVHRDQVRLRFSTGEPLYYSTAGRSEVRAGVITGFMQDTIILQRDTIALVQLRRIGDPSNLSRFHDKGYKILTAGILLGLGDFINVSVVQDKDYQPHPVVVIISAGLVSTGVIVLTRKPVVKINRRNRVVILNEGLHRRR